MMIAKVEQSISLERVFGEGNERNWEAFQELFKQAFSDEYKESFLEQARTKKNLRFRLIKEGDNPKGVVVYVNKTVSYPIFGLNEAFVIKALHVVPNFNRAVRNLLIDTAIEMKADSILLYVLSSAKQLCKDVKERSFKKIEMSCLISDPWELFVYKEEKKTEQTPETLKNEEGKREREKEPLNGANDNSSGKELKVGDKADFQ